MENLKYDWLHFAERSGEAGRAWAVAYRRHLDKVELSERALVLLRTGKIAEGGKMLQELAGQLTNARGESESVRAVLDRWFYGVAGYHSYCLGRFDEARESMDLAHTAVKSAISQDGCLMMLAVHCQEFCLHQARIARNQRRWPEMHACIERAQGMVLDRVPLCEKNNQQKIWFSTFRKFFASMAPLTPEESSVAAKLLDREKRTRLFDQFVRRLLRFQEIGIEYP